MYRNNKYFNGIDYRRNVVFECGVRECGERNRYNYRRFARHRNYNLYTCYRMLRIGGSNGEWGTRSDNRNIACMRRGGNRAE